MTITLDTDLPVTDEQAAELDRRLEALDRDPGSVSSWEEAKARILERLQ
jgi:putative addiction module component (TIGR02574 family)